MRLSEMLASEQGLMMLGTVLGGFWTALKSSEWYGRTRQRRYHKALTALEAGVVCTYESYVRAIKESREDGKLTDEERRAARNRARVAAVSFARTQGIDVVRELGEEYLDLWIAKMVRKQKA